MLAEISQFQIPVKRIEKKSKLLQLTVFSEVFPRASERRYHTRKKTGVNCIKGV
jgi:hypothetical protein